MEEQHRKWILCNLRWWRLDMQRRKLIIMQCKLTAIQFAMHCRPHALMTVTSGLPAHRELIAVNLRCITDAQALMKVKSGFATNEKLFRITCDVSPMRACAHDTHGLVTQRKLIASHAWTRNASEIDRMQLATCRRCTYALMTVTPGLATHWKLIACNLRCVTAARMQ